MSDPRASSLSDLIRARRDEILARWERAVRGRSTIAGSLDHTALLDHLPQLLARVAELAEGTDRESRDVAHANLADIHALQRLDEGFDLSQVVDEFGTLRSCILDLWWDDARPPTRDELRVLDEAIHAAVLTSVDRYARARERTLSSLDKISAAALKSRDIDGFLQVLLLVLVDTTESADTGAIFLRENEHQLRLRAAVGLEEDVRRGYTVKFGEGFSGTIAAEQRPSLIPNAAESPLIASDVVRARGVRGMYGVPLVGDDGVVIGVAQMGSRTAADFSDQDKRLFNAMAHRATAAIIQHLLRQSVDRRRAELEAVVRSIPDAVYLGDGPVMYAANDAAARLIGRTTGEKVDVGSAVPRLDVRDPVTREPLAAEADSFARALRGERVESEVLAIREGGGGDVFIRVAAAPIVLDRQTLGAVAIATDITQLKDLERAREEFISTVAHDLKTPLTAIRTLAQLTAKNLARAGDETNGARVRRIEAQVDRMNRLLSDLMDVTLAERGHLRVRLDEIDYGTLVHEAIEVWRTTSDAHVVDLSAPQHLAARADPDRVAQVLDNLLSNAIKYSPRGGAVRVSVVDDGEAIITSISDEGIGMTPDEQQKIFRPWTRARTDEAQRIPGHGLGLFVVSELVRAHGGRVWIESAHGAGTTVRFTLPKPPR